MRVLFIRHASALSRMSWLKDDKDRPLSDKGMTTAKKFYRELSKIYQAPDAIFCSETLRAKETAQLFARSFKGARLFQTALLNPGATFDDFKLLFQDEQFTTIAIIGHEPNLSDILSHILCGGNELSIDFKKAALVEVEMDEDFHGTLKAYIPPKLYM